MNDLISRASAIKIAVAYATGEGAAKAELALMALPAASQPEAEPVAFQQRVRPWMLTCFGAEISGDRLERGDRLLEEVFELLQSGDYPKDRVAALMGYVWSRPVGEPAQEVGGVMVTLAAYCLAHGLDMHEAGEAELARIWTKIEKIRAKQKAKPTGSALPQVWATPAPVVPAEGLVAEIIAAWAPALAVIRGYDEAFPYAQLEGDDEKITRMDKAITALRAQQPAAPVSDHPDDLAVDRFAAAMKAKLAKKREEGRGGWEGPGCNTEILSRLLREHVEKGDPLDVGNLAMMLHQRGERIAATPVSRVTVQEAGWQPISTAPRDGTPVDLWCLNLLHHAKKGFRKANVSWGTVTDWFGSEREDWRHGHGEDIQPTHWMPLPEPPAALEGK